MACGQGLRTLVRRQGAEGSEPSEDFSSGGFVLGGAFRLLNGGATDERLGVIRDAG